MTVDGRIRALLIESNPGVTPLAQDLVDQLTTGRIDLAYARPIESALELLASEAFDIVLYGLGHSDVDDERIDRLLNQAPATPIVVLAAQSEADLALPMIRYGAQDFWVRGRDTAEALLQAIRYALERKGLLQRLVQKANFDPLTGLPNRYLFEDRLNHATERARREGTPLAVMFLDLDGFKQVNDRLGHEVGDTVLCRLAERIRSTLRTSDTVARIGGDEFAIVLESLGSAEDATHVAEKLQSAVAVPLTEGNHRFDPSCSIGISYFLLNGTDARSLLAHADGAMYRAKRLGGGRYCQAVEDLSPSSLDRVELFHALRSGLDHGAFRVFFQPQIEVYSHAVWGFEALLRWQHPDRGLSGPDGFLAILDESSLSSRLGDVVLRGVCAQLQRWSDLGLRPPRVAINVSQRQLADGGLGDRIRMALSESGLQPHQLELEIKEQALIGHPEATTRALKELKDLGLALALDDFGNGHSAISYLRRLPIDGIKLDRHLIQGAGQRGTEQIIARSIIELAHSLAIGVVAKGVETKEQMAFVRESDCDAAQGFLISPPLDSAAATAWLADATRRLEPVA